MSLIHPLVVRQLNASYGTAPILSAITTTVRAGEVVAVLGSNGSGKSTFIKALLGLVPNISGTIEIYGHDARRHPRRAFAPVGYVPQRSPATPTTAVTALELVTSGLVSTRSLWPGHTGRTKALQALQTVGMHAHATDPIQEFSGGQLQRTLIARALVRQPELYLLDEPLAGVDRHSAQVVVDTLAAAHRRGATIITVLHELGPFAPLITRTLTIANGRLIDEQVMG
ncbi:MAG: ATP-binding cassette domain-containing protein [Bowdeniella nasicola]|nr:ATP-binding cassette domain-containing protein [Bowdeniella nasicola]